MGSAPVTTLPVVAGAFLWADTYGLSRPTVRRAIAALTAEGLVYAVSGRGTYVAEQQPETPAPGA
ncbi:GntR family transcriptional regulator [Streptomyces rugosispiralis]|uniref:GntR family transcriptional regulator n=1 Tax=Streptomyces rugosispiralis TaxID=2967341 RepID=A0ABT1V468_9ACTN|nr:GntR family transcriptional regulator [Streptomyces rugosispiralis]MCQ8192173.1 GntR family transcriptional regulator [Streptomyces rugosispiralis]